MIHRKGSIDMVPIKPGAPALSCIEGDRESLEWDLFRAIVDDDPQAEILSRRLRPAANDALFVVVGSDDE